jgi:8-oxo-dGTP diphosphatase
MGFNIEGPLLNQSVVCIPIIRSLPEWFGIEEAILNYEREIEYLPTFLAKVDQRSVGFLSLKQHTACAAEIYVMAVHPNSQRAGIGRALVATAEAYARGLGIEYMQVKTLGPSRPDEHYAHTRTFYQIVGFRPLEETSKIWDENNPCLILVKKLSVSEPKVGVAAIINKGDRVLLTLRKNVHGAGSWSTPGGHLDFGETPEQCAMREAKEEAGIEITHVRFRAITNDVFEALDKHYITIWMESEHLSGEPHVAADYEVAEIGWFTWDALPEPLFLPFKNLITGKCYPVPLHT